MLNPRNNRLKKELKDILKDAPPNCSAGLVGDDLNNWQAMITGPHGTPYEGGIFKLKVTIPREYPMKPPLVKFETKIYHPNVDAQGSVCADIFKDNWTPANTIASVLMSMRLLMEYPNPDDPLVPEIGREFKNDRAKFNRNARDWTNKYA